jgi:hypothetical protein
VLLQKLCGITTPVDFWSLKSQMVTTPMLSNHGCVRLDEPTTILVISMKMKPHGKSLGRNPLSDVPY